MYSFQGLKVSHSFEKNEFQILCASQRKTDRSTGREVFFYEKNYYRLAIYEQPLCNIFWGISLAFSRYFTSHDMNFFTSPLSEKQSPSSVELPTFLLVLLGSRYPRLRIETKSVDRPRYRLQMYE